MASSVISGSSSAIDEELHSLLSPQAGCEVLLRKIEAPTLLWLNESLATRDEAVRSGRVSLEEYGARLVEACSFRAVAEADRPTHAGMADRYGGSGLNGNGGSGRAVIVNGYYVKGVGRTPLIGDGTDRAHASGDAYLEEACREAIFAEIFAAELPFGAIRTLAIIDTGERAFWQEVDKYETKVLVVRLPFRRVGHFVRALAHRSLVDRTGSADALRVEHHFAQWTGAIGSMAVADAVSDLPRRVAKQLGYCFAHRLAHGSPTLSNIALDGRLLDFGATSSLPSYARARLSPISAGATFGVPARVLEQLGGFVAQCERATGLSFGAWSATVQDCQAAYEDEVVLQTGRLCGIHPSSISNLPSRDAQQLRADLARAFRESQASSVDLLRGDSRRAWAEAGAPGLPAAALTVMKRYGTPSTADAGPLVWPRPELAREEMRDVLYAQVDGRDAASRGNVGKVIDRWVSSNRRDFAPRSDAANPDHISRYASPAPRTKSDCAPAQLKAQRQSSADLQCANLHAS